MEAFAVIYGLFALIVIGLAWAIVVKVRSSDLSLPKDTSAGSTIGPSFGVVFVTVLKALIAIVIILVVVAVALLLIDQHVHSLT